MGAGGFTDGPWCSAEMTMAVFWRATQPSFGAGTSSCPALGMRQCTVTWMARGGFLPVQDLPSACRHTSCPACHHPRFYCRIFGRNWTPQQCTGIQQQPTSQQLTRAESKGTFSMYWGYRMCDWCNWQLGRREVLYGHTWTYWLEANMTHTLIVPHLLSSQVKFICTFSFSYQPAKAFHAKPDSLID